jgi:hypothetical protein
MVSGSTRTPESPQDENDRAVGVVARRRLKDTTLVSGHCLAFQRRVAGTAQKSHSSCNTNKKHHNRDGFVSTKTYERLTS